MSTSLTGEVVPGLWRFEALHPEWTEDEGGEDGWEPQVAWWAVAAPPGLVLVDPLVEEWSVLDRLVEAHGGCAGVVRTCHWHQRSVTEAAARYEAGVWAKPAPPPPGSPAEPEGPGSPHFDHPLSDRDEVFAAIVAVDVERADEVALWLPRQSALVFGDAMVRRASGELAVCPASWSQPPGGRARLLELLRALGELPVEHALVSHGPLVLGGGRGSLLAATA